jgi:hypothetical protein
MRSLNKFAKVEGHNSLVRDMSSHAIVSTNEAEFSAYQKRREIEKKRAQAIDNQVQEIQNLKNDMLEIKQMLSQLISTKGH